MVSPCNILELHILICIAITQEHCGGLIINQWNVAGIIFFSMGADDAWRFGPLGHAVIHTQ